MQRLLSLVLLLAAPAAPISLSPRSGALPPRPDHVLVVIMENHAYADVVGSSSAPYIGSLARAGANFTDSHGVTHPSQPNYLALFSGGTQGVTSNACPQALSAANLGGELISAGVSFAGYADGVPSDGYRGCKSASYARKHNPWVNFGDLAAPATNKSFASFPASYADLPTVAFVVPDMCHSMHDCPVATGDGWLARHVDGYVQWAKTHNSLLILTFDEDDGSTDNHIATIFVGPMVAPGDYGEHVTHYTVLRTLEDMYRLPHLGASARESPITDVWR
jgi:phosphatidylinositol-3-phosphatase